MTYSQAIDALLADHDVTRPGKPYYMSRIGTSTVAAFTKGTDVPWSGNGQTQTKICMLTIT